MLCCLAAQDSVADLLRKLHDGEAAERKAAADLLVRRGSAARPAVARALDQAGSDLRERYEEVLIRIDCGTDSARESLGPLEVELREAAASQEPVPQFGSGLKLSAVFEGTSGAPEPLTFTITRASLVTARSRIELPVKGPQGETFSRSFDPSTLKRIEYGAFLPPRFPPGTRYALVFEVEASGTRKLMRSGILPVAKKE